MQFIAWQKYLEFRCMQHNIQYSLHFLFFNMNLLLRPPEIYQAFTDNFTDAADISTTDTDAIYTNTTDTTNITTADAIPRTDTTDNNVTDTGNTDTAWIPLHCKDTNATDTDTATIPITIVINTTDTVNNTTDTNTDTDTILLLMAGMQTFNKILLYTCSVI